MSLIQTDNLAWLREQAKDPVFWEFLSITFKEIVQAESQAINVACWNIEADAVTDLDERTSIAVRFREQVRGPYAYFKQSFNNQLHKQRETT
jgi:hypothetical protein